MDLVLIRQTIETYMFGVDAKNLEALLGCFTEGAEALYHRGTVDEKPVLGGEAIARGVFESCSRFSASSHTISNFVATVDGNKATANTFAIANVIVAPRGWSADCATKTIWFAPLAAGSSSGACTPRSGRARSTSSRRAFSSAHLEAATASSRTLNTARVSSTSPIISTVWTTPTAEANWYSPPSI